MSEGGKGDAAKASSPGSARYAILGAAIDLIVESGPGSLTFRNVAQAAKVSLGTVTYHFSDKTELLRAAIEYARDATLRRDLAMLDGYLARYEVVDALAHYLEELTRQPDEIMLKAYRVYATALYFSDLRDLVSPWHLESMLNSLGHGENIRDAAIVGEGLLLYSLVKGVPVGVDEARRMLAPHLVSSGASR